MSNLEEENRDLKEKNNELVQKVQYWKMAAAQRESEKLALMKEINELRLKLSHVKNGTKVQTMKLQATVQAGNEKALAHLVRASSEIADIMELTTNYINNISELDTVAPRWNAIGGTPSSEKSDRVHRVPPTLVGGRSIQPVVSLSRTLFNSSANMSRVSNQSRSSERAVPMHMLQDVYIPLTRIDAEMPNVEVDDERNEDLEDSTEDLELEDEVQQLSEVEEYEPPGLDVVAEDMEEEEEINIPPSLDDGLEGPSWLLGPPPDQRTNTSSRPKEEPDSTTEGNEAHCDVSPIGEVNPRDEPENGGGISVRVSCEFSPTVRKRKRPPSPTPPPAQHPSPFTPKHNSARRNSVKGRVLKVMVTKMRLNGDDESNSEISPPKRPKPDRLMSFDAPSPSGATDSRVIVLDTTDIQPEIVSPISHVTVRGHSRKDKRSERNKRSERDLQSEQEEPSDGNEPLDQSDPNHRSNCGDQNIAKPKGQKERHKRREEASRKYENEVEVNDGDNENIMIKIEHDLSASERNNQNNLSSSSVRANRSRSREPVARAGRSDQHDLSVRNVCSSRSLSCEQDSKDRLEQSERGSNKHNSRRDRSEHVRTSSKDSRDSDTESISESITEGRSRRARKAVTYKEKPLNRKMRR